MTLVRLPFATLQREAIVDLLESYRDEVGIRLNVFPARPRSISTPHAFIDATRETVEPSSVRLNQRTLFTDVVVLWGLFDSAEAIAQADAFRDGFLEWVTDRVHATSPRTLLGISEIADEPTFTADWAREGQQGPYFAQRVTLEGFATT